MIRINILGAGELARQWEGHIKFSYPHAIMTFFDDVQKGENIFPFYSFRDHLLTGPFVIALGYNHLSLKRNISTEILAKGGKLFTYIHPTTFMAKSSQVGEGSVIYPLCNIDKEVILGDNCLVNNSVIISHNSKIGSACYISPGVVISGNVTIGDCCFIGSGAIISNNVSIGDNTIVGVGTVVTKSILGNVSVIGNPMKITSKPIKLV